ncbi:hypothetical protein MTHERMOG20_15490 [Moorella thermoacetica]|nr:hypothetical protein MTHERMOG20_15490 [Moorella thermoacetica]
MPAPCTGEYGFQIAVSGLPAQNSFYKGTISYQDGRISRSSLFVFQGKCMPGNCF